MIAPLQRGFLMRVGILLALIAAIPATPLHAQIPDKFTNLKVVPKDISKDELIDVMRGFSSALGVRCGFCHARKDPSPQSEFDWASDSKPEKETARVMMRMTRLINTEQIPKITTKDSDRVEVKCATCHHGQERPWQIEDVLTRAFKEGGVDSLESKYTALRKECYGSAIYNFSEQMLPALGERLGGRANPDVAVRLARFNLELFPESGYAHFALGQALATVGQKDAAAQELNKAVDLDPSLKRDAQRAVEQLETK